MINQLDIRILLVEPYDSPIILYTHQIKDTLKTQTKGNTWIISLNLLL
jgi:hypothetical protein